MGKVFAVRTPIRVRSLPAGKTVLRRSSGAGITLADQAYALLKGQIIEARYLPGQFLQEAQICADLGIGRTPVRQALQRLSHEGLLDVIHRKGVMVRSDTLTEILLALEARMLVEPYCAGRCAERASSIELDLLEKLHHQYAQVRQSGNRHMMMEIDRQLHILIGNVAGNKLLLELLRPIQERMSRLWFLPHWQIDDFGATADEHDALIDAIRMRQPEAASTAMRTHLESLKDRIMSGHGVGRNEVPGN